MENGKGFHTLKGYQLAEDPSLTPAMEDYLEMIYRISSRFGRVRINELSYRLNVKPSSASKMVRLLSEAGYLTAERYGNITLTDRGSAEGNYLIYRHNVIHGFLCLVNGSRNELEETEKIEHFLSRATVRNLDGLLSRLTGPPSSPE